MKVQMLNRKSKAEQSLWPALLTEWKRLIVPLNSQGSSWTWIQGFSLRNCKWVRIFHLQISPVIYSLGNVLSDHNGAGFQAVLLEPWDLQSNGRGQEDGYMENQWLQASNKRDSSTPQSPAYSLCPQQALLILLPYTQRSSLKNKKPQWGEASSGKPWL